MEFRLGEVLLSMANFDLVFDPGDVLGYFTNFTLGLQSHAFAGSNESSCFFLREKG